MGNDLCRVWSDFSGQKTAGNRPTAFRAPFQHLQPINSLSCTIDSEADRGGSHDDPELPQLELRPLIEVGANRPKPGKTVREDPRNPLVNHRRRAALAKTLCVSVLAVGEE
jgi:hypothetical protein